ncbi:MAG: cupin domain-containing protein [Hyphomicrobiales bacterium]|nr:cupin domain-containing protein [Hyphomicrobiales bacterium]
MSSDANVLNPEKYEKLAMELYSFAKEEQDRRQKSRILVPGEEIEFQLKASKFPVHMVDVRIGSNQKTFRFWKFRPTKAACNGDWKTIGHRHTVEAVVYVEDGVGYSVIDGIDYPWKPGDFICVPMFAWHRYVLEVGDHFTYLAATTGPLSMYLGLAVYEDERWPEKWVFAQKGDEALKSLIPGTVGSAKLDHRRFDPDKGLNGADSLYVHSLSFASQEEKDRRAGKVLVRGDDLVFEPTRMGSVALVIDPQNGFHMRTLGTLMAEIPAQKRSGAHRHSYEETNYIASGQGFSIIDDQRVDWKKGDTLCIPVFAWHQHFNTGSETARFLVHHNRPYMENMGFLMAEHGEDADY